MNLSIAENIRDVSNQVTLFEQKYDRVHGSVQLLAVSKTQITEKIIQAYDSGQQHFAENYLQEAIKKLTELSSLALTWHFIGPIQSNKTKTIAQHFSWVHSVDRLKIARRLSEQRPADLPPLKILLQVNLDNEASKAGCSLAELPKLAEAVNTLPRIVLSGLMTIPAPAQEIAQQRHTFRILAQARDELAANGITDCLHLSMGMSQDFEAAIAEGATMIRIGTGIFGPREQL